MRALPVLLLLTLLPAPAAAAVPLPLAERQVVTLELARPVARLATTDPGLLSLEQQGARLRVTALRAGRAQVDVTFDDGAVVTFEVTVEAARPSAPEAAPGELLLLVGEERRVPAPGLARLLVEENGVVQARSEGASVVLVGVSPGRASVVLVDADGRRSTLAVRVRQ
jgi:hypothetical protein